MVKRRISPKESVMHSSHLLAAGSALEVEPVPQYGRPGPPPNSHETASTTPPVIRGR